MAEIDMDKAIDIFDRLQNIKGIYLADHARPYLELTPSRRARFKGTLGQVMFVKAITDLSRKGVIEAQIFKASMTDYITRAFSRLPEMLTGEFNEDAHQSYRGKYVYVDYLDRSRSILIELPYTLTREEITSLNVLFFQINQRNGLSQSIYFSGYRLSQETRNTGDARQVERVFEALPVEALPPSERTIVGYNYRLWNGTNVRRETQMDSFAQQDLVLSFWTMAGCSIDDLEDWRQQITEVPIYG